MYNESTLAFFTVQGRIGFKTNVLEQLILAGFYVEFQIEGFSALSLYV
jgi:hypothetical protein